MLSVTLGAATNSWFGENIEAEKAENDTWLKQSFGIMVDDVNYPWGGIGSVADYKTGGASIVIACNDQESNEPEGAGMSKRDEET